MSASDPPKHLPFRPADALPKDAPTDAFSPPPESLSESEHPHLRVIFPDPQTIPDTEPKADAATMEACRRIGPYEVLAEIARGGMGMVFKVRDPRLGRVVALKMIRGGSFCNPEELRRFQREAKVQAQVTHRHLLPVLDVGEHKGEQYFTMPYVAGGTAAKRLQEFVGQPKKAVAVVEKVARAVAYAHQQGILHRDLKPSNILLDEEGEPLVADFGLAKQTDSSEQLTRSNQMIGTPPYMAPEQADPGSLHEVTPRTDVWSLGVVLYELLTGKLPFPGKTNTEVFAKVRRQEPPPPRRYLKDLDPALEKIILRCLEKEPTYRYPTAADLADDLAKWQKGEKVAPSPVPFSVRLRRRLDRWPVLKLLGAAALALLLVVILWLALPPRGAEHVGSAPQVAETRPQEQDYWAWVREELRAGRSVPLIPTVGGPVKMGERLGNIRDMLSQHERYRSFYVLGDGICRIPLLPQGCLPESYRIRLRLKHDTPKFGVVGIYALCNRVSLPDGREAVCYVSLTIGKHGTVEDEYKRSNSVLWLWGHLEPVGAWAAQVKPRTWENSTPQPPSKLGPPPQDGWRTLVLEVRPKYVRIYLDGTQLEQVGTRHFLPAQRNVKPPLPVTPEEAPNAFATNGELGLFAYSAGMTVQDMVVEPLTN
jgi:serine/threonine protein kinase